MNLANIRKTLVAVVFAVLETVNVSLTDGSLPIPEPWRTIIVAAVGAYLVYRVPNAAKEVKNY